MNLDEAKQLLKENNYIVTENNGNDITLADFDDRPFKKVLTALVNYSQSQEADAVGEDAPTYEAQYNKEAQRLKNLTKEEILAAVYDYIYYGTTRYVDIDYIKNIFDPNELGGIPAEYANM